MEVCWERRPAIKWQRWRWRGGCRRRITKPFSRFYTRRGGEEAPACAWRRGSRVLGRAARGHTCAQQHYPVPPEAPLRVLRKGMLIVRNVRANTAHHCRCCGQGANGAARLCAQPAHTAGAGQGPSGAARLCVRHGTTKASATLLNSRKISDKKGKIRSEHYCVHTAGAGQRAKWCGAAVRAPSSPKLAPPLRTPQVLDKGRVAQCGSHGELLDAGGMYANMWSRQVRAHGRMHMK